MVNLLGSHQLTVVLLIILVVMFGINLVLKARKQRPPRR